MGFTPQRKHGFYILVMVVGWVLPPIAVLLRFGFGKDFLINIVLTLAGYIPGYLQNIRNNQNCKRTPKWACKAGLIKDPTIKRKKKTQWANRYDERTPTRADGYQDDDLEPSRNVQPKRSSLDLENDNHHNSSSPSFSLSTNTSSSVDSNERPQRPKIEDLEAKDLDKFLPTPTPNRRRGSKTTVNRNSTSQKKDSIRRSKSIGPASNLEVDPYAINQNHSLSRRFSINSIVSHAESRKSLGQKFGFKKRNSDKRNRFDKVRDGKAQWSVSSDPRLNQFHYQDDGMVRRSLPVNRDGLDHEF
ncbi:hypothetical protein BY996DRAFT_6413240 [Phakopsora pachyrhizi]|nr:hypothetical protein BY996DRAFT_6413240 [Phakopsora pachyrhizi]